MAAPWTSDERDEIVAAIDQHPVASGRCAALARIVFEVGRRRDEDTRGCQVRPRNRARYVLPKHPAVPRWHTHTYAEAHCHAVDAMTGAEGCDPSVYLERHFHYANALEVVEVDVHQVDPGIEDEQ